MAIVTKKSEFYSKIQIKIKVSNLIFRQLDHEIGCGEEFTILKFL